MTHIVFASEPSVVGVGFDCEPYVFQVGPGVLKKIKSLDAQQAAAAAGQSNMKMWQNMDKKRRYPPMLRSSRRDIRMQFNALLKLEEEVSSLADSMET